MYTKSKSIPPISFTGDREFYNIPLLGEVRLEDTSGSGGDYSLGELIKNFRKRDQYSITLRTLDSGLEEDGIFYGDYLTVDLGSKPRNGDITAVRIGEKVFIRKINFTASLIRLETTDPYNAPLIIDSKMSGFEIIGKVHTVIREL